MSRKLQKKKRKKWKPNDSPARWRSIKQKYGLEKRDYEEILSEQHGRCFICRKLPHETKPRQNLSVDHDHATGRIRGLLCFNCNHNILGRYIRDDVEKAKRIVEYLERKTNYGQVHN